MRETGKLLVDDAHLDENIFFQKLHFICGQSKNCSSLLKFVIIIIISELVLNYCDLFVTT